MPKKRGTLGKMELISLSYINKILKVYKKNLQDWKNIKEKILEMKKGVYYTRGPSFKREPKLEFKLNAKFKEERTINRIILSI